MKGGWVGQMAGVTWGSSTEFVYSSTTIPDAKVPVWSTAWINDAFAQDDLYVEIPFLDTMTTHGVSATWQQFGDTFRDTRFQLYHGNNTARLNLKATPAVPAPWSGHYSKSTHAEDIDWQIESDFAGAVAPGMPQAAIDIAWRAGHVVGYGEGVNGGVVVAAMRAKAFTASNVNEIIEAGRTAAPLGSEYRKVIEDLIAWKSAGKTWQETWQLTRDKWAYDENCSSFKTNPRNIEAKYNGAFIFMGLLYGGNDFEQSMKIAMQCGQDSDCNPSSVGGILGTYYGFSAIPDKFKSALNSSTKFSYTSYSLDDCLALTENLARETVVRSGGTVSIVGGQETWMIPQQDVVAPILELVPVTTNTAPKLDATAALDQGMTAIFEATASDADGILDYYWFFGDLSYARGASVEHVYRVPGDYEVICYVTDGVGNTSWQSVSVTVPEPGTMGLLGTTAVLALWRWRHKTSVARA